jgi:hypothetical protein
MSAEIERQSEIVFWWIQAFTCCPSLPADHNASVALQAVVNLGPVVQNKFGH